MCSSVFPERPTLGVEAIFVDGELGFAIWRCAGSNWERGTEGVRKVLKLPVARVPAAVALVAGVVLVAVAGPAQLSTPEAAIAPPAVSTNLRVSPRLTDAESSDAASGV